MSSRSHYLHSKVHGEARVSTGSTVSCCPRHESACLPDKTISRAPPRRCKKAAASTLRPSCCRSMIVGSDRAFRPNLSAPLTLSLGRRRPQKTKASPSLSRQQAQEPELPALTASARELPSPSSALLSSQPSWRPSWAQPFGFFAPSWPTSWRPSSARPSSRLLGGFLARLLRGLLGCLLCGLLRRYSLLGFFGLLAFFLLRFRHRGPPVAAEQWSIGRLQPSPPDESSGLESSNLRVQCRPRPARSPIEKLNRVYDRN